MKFMAILLVLCLLFSGCDFEASTSSKDKSEKEQPQMVNFNNNYSPQNTASFDFTDDEAAEAYASDAKQYASCEPREVQIARGRKLLERDAGKRNYVLSRRQQGGYPSYDSQPASKFSADDDSPLAFSQKLNDPLWEQKAKMSEANVGSSKVSRELDSLERTTKTLRTQLNELSPDNAKQGAINLKYADASGDAKIPELGITVEEFRLKRELFQVQMSGLEDQLVSLERQLPKLKALKHRLDMQAIQAKSSIETQALQHQMDILYAESAKALKSCEEIINSRVNLDAKLADSSAAGQRDADVEEFRSLLRSAK